MFFGTNDDPPRIASQYNWRHGQGFLWEKGIPFKRDKARIIRPTRQGDPKVLLQTEFGISGEVADCWIKEMIRAGLAAKLGRPHEKALQINPPPRGRVRERAVRISHPLAKSLGAAYKTLRCAADTNDIVRDPEATLIRKWEGERGPRDEDAAEAKRCVTELLACGAAETVNEGLKLLRHPDEALKPDPKTVLFISPRAQRALHLLWDNVTRKTTLEGQPIILGPTPIISKDEEIWPKDVAAVIAELVEAGCVCWIEQVTQVRKPGGKPGKQRGLVLLAREPGTQTAEKPVAQAEVQTSPPPEPKALKKLNLPEQLAALASRVTELEAERAGLEARVTSLERDLEWARETEEARAQR